MDIVSAFNPPRMIMLAGRVFWIRALSQEDFAILVAWLDDVLPGKADRTMPPKLNDEASQKALDSAMGWSVQAWAALRHCGIGYDQATELILKASDTEKVRFSTVFFRQRPTYKPSGAGENLSEAWWGPMVARLSESRHFTVPQIAAMTLDQVDMLRGDGLEEERPNQGTVEDWQAQWEKDHAAWLATQAEAGEATE